MRHRLFIVMALIIIVPAAVFAAGFGQPSNPAGVWEMTLTEGIHLISFPVLPEGATITRVLGDQFPGGSVWDDATRIIGMRADAIVGSYYNDVTEEWTGDLVDLNISDAYWLVIPDGEPDVEIRLIGAALSMAETTIKPLSPGMNYVACPAIVPVTLAGSGLIESGCVAANYAALADRVYTYSSDLLMPAWKHPTEGWIGAEFTFHPGKGYIVERATGEFDFDWIRPELVVGAEPPRGGLEAAIPRSLRPLLEPVTFDFNTPPGQSRTRNTGGQR